MCTIHTHTTHQPPHPMSIVSFPLLEGFKSFCKIIKINGFSPNRCGARSCSTGGGHIGQVRQGVIHGLCGVGRGHVGGRGWGHGEGGRLGVRGQRGARSDLQQHNIDTMYDESTLVAATHTTHSPHNTRITSLDPTGRNRPTGLQNHVTCE